MDTSTTDKVPCNGPCRKRFRPAAVRLDQATSSVLLSSARASGLLWLCPECHQAFNLQQPVKRYESDLPPELWIMIFRNLDKRSTLRVRLTCRRWKDIVDLDQSLLKKLPLDFGKDATIDDRFQPENLFPATSMASMNRLQLTTLILQGNDNLIVQLSRTQVAVEVLFITAATNEALCKIGRNLTKLKDLAVNMNDNGTVVPTFLDQMPQLKRLNLIGTQYNIVNQHLHFEETLIRFLLQCSRVENLLLFDVDAVNDQLIGTLNRLSQLKELAVCDCPVTDKSVEFIVENCSHVVVQISCEQISKLAMKLLDQVMRTR
ncbi:hypothetical protein quinque_008352 [Culex quinquefasciatus]